jgi:hypothetical protein
MSFSPPSEYDETSPPPVSRQSGSFLEVSCLFAQSMPGFARHDGFHAVAAFRPQVFSTSRRFAPQDISAGLFHPACTSRLCPSGSFPLQEPSWLIANTSALWWLSRVRLLFRDDRARNPTSGPCSPGESVAFDPQLSEPLTRYPLGLSPLQGFLHFGRASCFHETPLTSLPFFRTRRENSAPQGLVEPKDGSSLARLPALWRFLAFSITRSFKFVCGPGLSFRLGRDAASPLHRLTSLVRHRSLPQPLE